MRANIYNFGSLLMVALISCGLSPATANSAKDDTYLSQFSIVVTPMKNFVKAGLPVIVEVRLKNISMQTIGLAAGEDAAPWYTVEVRRNDALVAESKSVQGKKRKTLPPLPPGTFRVDNYSRIMGELRAGDTLKEKVVVSDLYDLGQPGEYSIQAQCQGTKSNVAKVSVVP